MRCCDGRSRDLSLISQQDVFTITSDLNSLLTFNIDNIIQSLQNILFGNKINKINCLTKHCILN